MNKRTSLTYQMDTCHQAPYPHQYLWVVKFWRTTSSTRTDTEPEMAIHTLTNNAGFMQTPCL
jgi:hypothetical protein